MREIKFRAWDKRRGRFHGACSNVCLDLSGRLMWQFGYNAPDMLSLEETINFDLQQFTGLKDKNGKEIYEGDVLANVSPAVVKYDVGKAAFVVGDYGCELGRFNRESGREVIGNIYENPELLEAK